MSVEKRGDVWRVRWRDVAGRERSHVVGRKADAVHLDAEIKRRKRLGTLAEMDAGTVLLSEFVKRWWDQYASAHLAPRTQASYIGVWDNHVGPYLGDSRLRDITPASLEAWLTDLRGRGVGEPTMYRALAVVQGVLQRAVEWGELRTNPARDVRRPRVTRARAVQAVPEQGVLALLQHGGDVARVAAFMAYAGLRPSELRALQWEDVRENTILIDKACDADGTAKPTKTYRTRTVPVRDELRPYLTGGTGPVFGRCSDNSWKAWVRRHWPATFPPYDLRHTYVSTLIAEGENPLEVAMHAGHQPSVALDIYGHLFEERRDRRS